MQGVHIQIVMRNTVSYYFHFHCYCQLNELKRRVPSNSVLCLFYNTEMYVLSFCLYFRIVFMFSILGEEVSHISPFNKPFWDSSDAHSGFSMAWILESTLGSSYLCGMECELVYGMVDLLWTLVLKYFSLIDFVIVNMSCKIKWFLWALSLSGRR